jgi:thioredoxin reductase (NADPH)
MLGQQTRTALMVVKTANAPLSPFMNSVKLMLAELPGPWEQWREKCRAKVIHDIDLIQSAQETEEAPLNSVTKERRRASMGEMYEQKGRFKQIKHQVNVPKPLRDLPVRDRRRVVIVGAGPSGYTAAMYTSRAALRPLLFCGPITGGQLMLTSDIENFPGYPEAVSGPQMMSDLRRQAERFGAEIEESLVEAVDLSQRPFRLQVRGEEAVVEADSVIIATGASARWLNAPGEEALRGQGISTCAVCDGALFFDEDVAVVGGGDTALEDALFLARFASSVTLIHRSDHFKASALMLDRAHEEPKITIKAFAQIKEWMHDGNDLTGAILEDTRDTASTEECKFSGAFLAIGHDAQSKLFQGQLAMDKDGYILHSRPGFSTVTSIPGVFSCGDVSDRRYRQAVTAAGHGCQAALDAERWLDRLDVGY